MRLKLTELKRALRRVILEYNDQDYQDEVEEIVGLFYDQAAEYEQYMPISLEILSPEQIQLIVDFNPPEFSNVHSMDSSAMLELSPDRQEEVNQWLADKDWYEGDSPLGPDDGEDLWL